MKVILHTIVAGMILFACTSQSNENMNKKVETIELVIYKVKEGVTDGKALLAATSVNDFIKSQPGFIARKLSQSPDGKWVDMIYWESLTAAQNANEKAMKSPATASFFDIISQKEIQFYHLTPKLEIN
ncbi:MAG: hypothetical protein AAFQ94_30660 [Bacteroidota bacterium]